MSDSRSWIPLRLLLKPLDRAADGSTSGNEELPATVSVAGSRAEPSLLDEAEYPRPSFWAFVDEQWVASEPSWEANAAVALVSRRLALAYLRQVATSERDAISHLIELSERDFGPVRTAARRLYHSWQEHSRR